MMRAVSVETGLKEIKDHLHFCGYEVFDMAECFRPIEAVIYTGEVMAVANDNRGRLARNTMLINAAGLNGAEVAYQLDARLDCQNE